MLNIAEGEGTFDPFEVMIEVAKFIPDTTPLLEGHEAKLLGVWYAVPDSNIPGRAENRRAFAVIKEEGDDKVLAVSVDSYIDEIVGDEIDEKAYQIGRPSENTLFSRDQKKAVEEVLWHCETFGLVPPNVKPEVIKRLKEDGNHSDLIKSLTG